MELIRRENIPRKVDSALLADFRYANMFFTNAELMKIEKFDLVAALFAGRSAASAGKVGFFIGAGIGSAIGFGEWLFMGEFLFLEVGGEEGCRF